MSEGDALVALDGGEQRREACLVGEVRVGAGEQALPRVENLFDEQLDSAVQVLGVLFEDPVQQRVALRVGRVEAVAQPDDFPQ